MKSNFVLAGAVLALATAASAVAGTGDGVIFDTRVGAGAYHSTTPTGDAATNFVIDVSGALVIGDVDNSNIKVDLGMVTGVRDGGAHVMGADVALSGTYMATDRYGFEAKIPFKYRYDDQYYEFSALEVSAVVKLVNSGGHQVIAKAGLNPYTKRTYKNDFGSFRTTYDPVAVSEGVFDRPSDAQVYGTPSYRHDPSADYSYADNRDVYFGGGTLDRRVDTSFDTSEHSIRVPVSIEYKYKSSDQKLVIQAVAYYTLRAGWDNFTQNDDYLDVYRGYVSYTNVKWNRCYNSDGSSYYCDPYNIQYNGDGHVAESYRNATTLDSKGFVGHTVGGKATATYSVYKNEAVEVLLNADARAEVDTHVLDANTGIARSAKRVWGTLGTIVRF